MTALLEIRDLEVAFPARGVAKAAFRVLHGISLDIKAGETVGLVGESGSGKTTAGRAVLGLAPVSGGTILYGGRDITHLNRVERRSLSSEIQVVFQDPYSSLNPAMTIGQILSEPLTAQRGGGYGARERIADLLDRVNLPADSVNRLPREFSGGQRQRIAIARALALDPALIVCDEPVSALDLSTQARVLDLFIEIQERTGVAYLFISHDLAVIRHVSHRVAVMYRGEIVEAGPAERVTSAPEHPYTQRLMMAQPVPDPALQQQRRIDRRRILAAQQAAGANL